LDYALRLLHFKGGDKKLFVMGVLIDKKYKRRGGKRFEVT